MNRRAVVATVALWLAGVPTPEAGAAACAPGRGASECVSMHAAADTVRSVEATGRVVTITPGFVTIAHDDIPGLMSPMTMEFDLASPALAQGIAPGHRVRFTLQVRGADMRVTRLRRDPDR
jgi:Cu/Ag efflux protein CusF